MGTFTRSLRHNISRLTVFGGRDQRALFWPYALIICLLAIIGFVAVFVPFMLETMTRMQRFAGEHPELTTVSQGPASYEIRIQGHHPELMPDMASYVISIAVVMYAAVALVAAAMVRRLRDAGRSPIWAFLPGLCYAVSLSSFGFAFADGQPNFAYLLPVMLGNLLTMGFSAALLAFLMFPSRQPEANAR